MWQRPVDQSENCHQRHLEDPPGALYLRSQPPTPKHMEDLLWIEIADAPGEIFDIPEMMDDDEEDSTFNAKLNSNFDF